MAAVRAVSRAKSTQWMYLEKSGGIYGITGYLPGWSQDGLIDRELLKVFHIIVDAAVFYRIDGLRDRCRGIGFCQRHREHGNGTGEGSGTGESGSGEEGSFDGTILESYPAQFGEVYSLSGYGSGTEQNPGGSYYDLCGLYLQVLDELWNRDPGLKAVGKYLQNGGALK